MCQSPILPYFAVSGSSSYCLIKNLNEFYVLCSVPGNNAKLAKPRQSDWSLLTLFLSYAANMHVMHCIAECFRMKNMSVALQIPVLLLLLPIPIHLHSLILYEAGSACKRRKFCKEKHFELLCHSYPLKKKKKHVFTLHTIELDWDFFVSLFLCRIFLSPICKRRQAKSNLSKLAASFYPIDTNRGNFVAT